MFLAMSPWTLALGVLMAVASGCTTVTFPEPMPMNRKDHDTFPQSWQGTWTSHPTSDNPGSDEILIIGEQTFRMPDGDPQILGRDVVLRKMGRHHVLSSPTEVDGITRWTVAVARMDGDQLRIVTFESPEQHHLHVWQELLGDERVEVQTKEGRDDKLKSVGLNPRNNRQFRKLLRHGTTTNHTFRQLVPSDNEVQVEVLTRDWAASYLAPTAFQFTRDMNASM